MLYRVVLQVQFTGVPQLDGQIPTCSWIFSETISYSMLQQDPVYDGHSTHVTFDVIQAARKENIHLFVLPPHSSHRLQPLDVSVFSPFKRSLSTECHKFLHSHPNCVIVKEDLPKDNWKCLSEFFDCKYNNVWLQEDRHISI